MTKIQNKVSVMTAKAGIQGFPLFYAVTSLDSSPRGNDEFITFRNLKLGFSA
jgi:hypothetical protein